MMLSVLKPYRKIIIAGLGLIVVLIAAWQYQIHEKRLYNVRASIAYQNLFNALTQNNTEHSDEYLMTLKKDFARSGYTALGVLMQARFEVEKKSYDTALQELNWVMLHSTDHKHFQQIARIRAAQILLMQKKYQEALTVLETLDEPTFKALVDEAKGDIYTAEGKTQAAKQSYVDAIHAFTALHVQNDPLLRKVDALS